jgi:sugar phosphate isomerase/epimerase
MKLGIAVAPATALPSAFVVFRDKIELSIQKAHTMGFDGVELALLDSSQIVVEDVQALCQQHRVAIPMISSGQVYAQGQLCFTSPDSAVRKEAVSRIKGLIDLAERLESMVNIGRVRGPLQPGEPPEKSESRFLEPVNRYEINFINRVDEACEVIGKIDAPNVKIMPDLFHMNIEEASIEATLMTYRDHIAYIHFADSNRLAPGMGHLNFPNIVQVLRSIEYDGYVTAEILPHPTPDEAAQQAARYLRALVPA